MPPPPTLENKITVGNLIQIGVMLVAITSAFVFLQSQAQASLADLRDHEDRIRTLERDVLSGLASIDHRLAVIERAQEKGGLP